MQDLGGGSGLRRQGIPENRFRVGLNANLLSCLLRWPRHIPAGIQTERSFPELAGIHTRHCQERHDTQ